ncbi:MAG: TRAP transporter TatT component family protein [Candidatus Calescibacterium sp.]|nr:TRAP transporter TatT component family protein [Candidatus Calescibacterium sp.]
MKGRIFIVAAFFLFGGSFLYSCNIRRIALIATAETTADFAPEAQKYDVAFIAAAGIPSNIMIMETARRLDPDNPKILGALAQIYCSYGFGFVEDQSVERAQILYYKGYQYAERTLALKNKKFAETLEKLKNNEAFPEDLAKTLTKDDIKDGFWYGSCLAYWIAASGGSPESVAEISKMVAVLDRLIELDDSFFYGGPLLLRASFYATAPSILGGSPVKSKILFDRAMKKSDGKFLLAKLAYARFYASLLKDKKEKELYEEEIQRLKDKIKGYESTIAEIQDQEIKAKFQSQLEKMRKELEEISKPEVAKLFSDRTGEQIFDETIKEIFETKSDVLPDAVLPNEIAKEKAKKLLERRADIF